MPQTRTPITRRPTAAANGGQEPQGRAPAAPRRPVPNQQAQGGTPQQGRTPQRGPAPAQRASAAPRRAGPAPASNVPAYRPRTVQDVQRQATRKTSRFDSIFKSSTDVFKARAGSNTVRPLEASWETPNGERPDHYGYPVWVHKYIGADEGTYLCPNKMLGQPCIICDAERQARDAQDKETAKALGVRQDMVWYIIDRLDNAMDTKPQVWQMSSQQDKEIQAVCYNPRTQAAIFPEDPDNGYDLTFNRVGTNKHTRYGSWQFDRDPSPLHPDRRTQDEIRRQIYENPIPELLLYYDNDYLERVLYGTNEETDEQLAGGEEVQDHAAERQEAVGRAPLRGRRAAPAPEVEEPAAEEPPFDVNGQPTDEIPEGVDWDDAAQAWVWQDNGEIYAYGDQIPGPEPEGGEEQTWEEPGPEDGGEEPYGNEPEPEPEPPAPRGRQPARRPQPQPQPAAAAPRGQVRRQAPAATPAAPAGGGRGSGRAAPQGRRTYAP